MSKKNKPEPENEGESDVEEEPKKYGSSQDYRKGPYRVTDPGILRRHEIQIDAQIKAKQYEGGKLKKEFEENAEDTASE